MVWPWMSIDGHTNLPVIKRDTLKAHIDRCEILQPIVRPFACAVGDNARVHTSIIYMDLKETVDWLSRSPDLIIIEHVWNLFTDEYPVNQTQHSTSAT